MIEFTATNVAALMVGLLGLLFVTNGFRHGFWDETTIGGLLLTGAWWLL